MDNRISVFDLDNTLVFTDKLNNESYNFALVTLGKEKIVDVKRITRAIVYSRYALTEDEKYQVVKLKQEYFINNLCKIEINNKLITILRNLEPSKCVLWTRAEKVRTEAILKFLCIDKCFSNVFYSQKYNVETDVNTICNLYNCNREDLVYYDDEVGHYQ